MKISTVVKRTGVPKAGHDPEDLRFIADFVKEFND